MIDLDLHHECIESRLILTANPTGLVSSEGIQWEKANLVMNSYAWYYIEGSKYLIMMVICLTYSYLMLTLL